MGKSSMSDALVEFSSQGWAGVLRGSEILNDPDECLLHIEKHRDAFGYLKEKILNVDSASIEVVTSLLVKTRNKDLVRSLIRYLRINSKVSIIDGYGPEIRVSGVLVASYLLETNWYLMSGYNNIHIEGRLFDSPHIEEIRLELYPLMYSEVWNQVKQLSGKVYGTMLADRADIKKTPVFGKTELFGEANVLFEHGDLVRFSFKEKPSSEGNWIKVFAEEIGLKEVLLLNITSSMEKVSGSISSIYEKSVNGKSVKGATAIGVAAIILAGGSLSHAGQSKYNGTNGQSAMTDTSQMEDLRVYNKLKLDKTAESALSDAHEKTSMDLSAWVNSARSSGSRGNQKLNCNTLQEQINAIAKKLDLQKMSSDGKLDSKESFKKTLVDAHKMTTDLFGDAKKVLDLDVESGRIDMADHSSLVSDLESKIKDIKDQIRSTYNLANR